MSSSEIKNVVSLKNEFNLSNEDFFRIIEEAFLYKHLSCARIQRVLSKYLLTIRFMEKLIEYNFSLDYDNDYKVLSNYSDIEKIKKLTFDFK